MILIWAKKGALVECYFIIDRSLQFRAVQIERTKDKNKLVILAGDHNRYRLLLTFRGHAIFCNGFELEF